MMFLATSSVNTRICSLRSPHGIIRLSSSSTSSATATSSDGHNQSKTKTRLRRFACDPFFSDHHGAHPVVPPRAPRRSPFLASRLTDHHYLDQPTVWHEFSPLAQQHRAVNLGQGFPDGDPPAFVLDALRDTTNTTNSSNGGSPVHQYARSAAHLPLAEVLAELYSARWNVPIDPLTQVATTVGCTQALYCALQGLVDPGDEVVLLEPAFDIYDAQVKLAGGVSVFVPLLRHNNEPKDVDLDAAPTSNTNNTSNQVFQLDWDALDAALARRPRILILNTPHNPTGKVFSLDELQKIAQKLPPETIVITDEVYEHLVFDHPHTSMATLLPDQTLTLSSSGKTFSCTGWKVGWAVGPPRLVRAVAAVQQWINFSAPTPNQHAVAQCLQHAAQTTPYVHSDGAAEFPNYYAYLAADYQRKRDLLVDALRVAGMTPIIPQGGFFVMADTASIEFPYAEQYQHTTTAAMPHGPMPRDWALARWLTQMVGVTAIPPNNFYSAPRRHSLAPNLLRFAFCKTDDTLREAHLRFENYFGSQPKQQ